MNIHEVLKVCELVLNTTLVQKVGVYSCRNKMELDGWYRRKVNSKAFAIPILTTRL